MTVTVVFAGLMLICLDGQIGCPQEPPDYGNTAWVLKAEDGSEVCGWYSQVATELQIVTTVGDGGDFESPDLLPHGCEEDLGKLTCTVTEPNDICVNSVTEGPGDIESTLRWLPRIDEIDRRFKRLLSRDKLIKYAPTRIHFSNGISVGGGPLWPDGFYTRVWFRSDWSDGGAFPRALSDRLNVKYKVESELHVESCGKDDPEFDLVLTPKKDDAEITFRNRAKSPYEGKEPWPLPDTVGPYDNLVYLLWYYRLGSWATGSGDCPQYTKNKREAILLRCVRIAEDNKSCADEPGLVGDTTYWPVMLGPSY